jgi:hypothetical protein
MYGEGLTSSTCFPGYSSRIQERTSNINSQELLNEDDACLGFQDLPFADFEKYLKPNIQVFSDCEVKGNELIPNHNPPKQEKVSSFLVIKGYLSKVISSQRVCKR